MSHLNAKEALQLYAASASGEDFCYICNFERVDGSIIFEETSIIENKCAFFLEPVRNAWGISKKPRIIIEKYRIERNSPCPCRSGKKYKNCCASSFDNNKLEKALSLYNKGDFVEAEQAFRNHLTQYIIWHNEHTMPFFLHDPLNAKELLLLDIDAVTELINFITNCLHFQNKNQDIDYFLNNASDIIDDERFRKNIKSLQEFWLKQVYNK